VYKANSTDILIRIDENGEAEGGGECFLVPESAFAPSVVISFEDTSREVDEDEYVEIIKRHGRREYISIVGAQHGWASERVLVYTSDFVIVAYHIPRLSNHLDRGRISVQY
jgi:hypothetical protein